MIIRREFPGLDIMSFSSLGEAIDQSSPATKIVLLDYRLSGISGPAAVGLAQAHWTAANIVILTSEDPATVEKALVDQPNVRIVSKSQPPSELVSVIRQALADPAWQGSKPARALSVRQLEMLRYLREGHSNKAIAKLSALSEFTVRGHLQQIYKLLGASNRTSAVYLAEKAGLI